MKYTASNDIKATVSNAIKGYNKGRRGVQNAAVQVLIHAYKHGDYSQAQVLCDGVGNKSLVKWFTDFGGLKVEGNAFTGWSGKEFIAKSFEKTPEYPNGVAKHTMYWEYKAENIWAGHDDLKAAKSLISKHNAAAKVIADDPTLDSKVSFHPELIAAIEEAIEKIEAA